MFVLNEDWSDDGQSGVCEGQSVTRSSEQTTCTVREKPKGVVGKKKSLLRTLHMLASVPEWKHQEQQEFSDSDSDSEGDPKEKKKRKKKKNNKGRKRRRRHTEMTDEQGEDRGTLESVKEQENPASAKKKKKDAKPASRKDQRASTGGTEEKTVADSEQPNTDQLERTDKLSRRQWKNKMKNKRKCKNKFRQDQTEARDAAGRRQEINIESSSQTIQVEDQKEVKSTKISQKDWIVKKGAERSSKVSRSISESTVQEPKPFKSSNDQQQISCSGKQEVKLSKDQILKREKLRKFLQGATAQQLQSLTEQSEEPEEPEERAEVEPPPTFRARMEQRLESARFRYINQVLYSTSSGEARRMFKQDPQAFWVYHKGYTAQVQRWPANPVDAIISYIQKRSSSLLVADFGCGDCKIARSVQNKVHSFDLAAICELVTVCDMAHVPLEDASVDIAVFCLSLMGTNLIDFLSEANRVLKNRGVLKIAEVASRFDNVRNFITALSRLGFKMTSKDTENTHFFSFEFEKTANVPESAKKLALQLKPCLYKKR